jgi:hypothetical protein
MKAYRYSVLTWQTMLTMYKYVCQVTVFVENIQSRVRPTYRRTSVGAAALIFAAECYPYVL